MERNKINKLFIKVTKKSPESKYLSECEKHYQPQEELFL